MNHWFNREREKKQMSEKTLTQLVDIDAADL